MSWLFSQALVEEFSAVTCSDGEPSAQLNVMPTPQPFSRRGKTTGFSHLSQSGLTFAPLTERRGQELLTLFLEGFLARTSAPQGKEPESQEKNQASGSTWRESWLMFDPDTSSWRTPQCSLLGDSESFSGTWPRSGSMRNGVCLEQPPLALGIDENGSGFLLPTPSGVNGGRNNMMGRVDEWGGSSNPLRGTAIGSMCLPPFEELVMGWPIGWTEPTPFETARFHEWQQQHSIFSAAASKEAA
ncbi:hypothetical protein RAS14_04415 [Achromobacter aegrifaciens]|nr:hypothetical protein [Achromobacter aegrifaciens]MDQ1758981.1 hypothetical protein [Achromobacter aegrifaciens]